MADGHNADLAAAYGVKLDPASLPVLTVLDAAGKPLATGDGRQLASAGNPQELDKSAVAEFLIKQHAVPPDANQQFQAALNQAKSEDKSVFVWFSGTVVRVVPIG